MRSFAYSTMLFLWVFSLFVVPSLANECGISNPIEEQTDDIAPLGKWPWQVYVRTPDSICGGTIIASRWILTAAHCFEDHLEGKIPSIRAGVVDIDEESGDNDVYYVENVYVHSEYDAKTVVNDIALLELNRTIKYSQTISPICLANGDQDVNVDQEAWIIGFGSYMNENNELVTETSNVLRESSIPLSRHSKCKSAWKGTDMDQIICAGSKGLGAGEGDSGGPLMLQSVEGPWYQAGIVSFGVEDKEIVTDHNVGAYTSVGHYCDWIEEMTRGAAKCAEKEVEMKLLPENQREESDENQREKSDENQREESDEIDDEDEETNNATAMEWSIIICLFVLGAQLIQL